MAFDNKINTRLFGILVALLAVVTLALSTVGVATNKSAVAFADEIAINAKSAYLTDSNLSSVMFAKNENERFPIASMVKIMTSLLTFEAIDRGELDYSDMILVSDYAESMGGSQVFLDAGKEYKVEELLKSVIVASANDSCVALAERIGGSVEGFVSAMNERARELGMDNTNFVNCTGLPAPDGYSSAKDVATMFSKLISHEKYFDFAGIWLEDFAHPDGRTTVMTNTNKLIRNYRGCDGGKTGFTSEAKFCLSATAERNGLRTIAVVIGADGSKERFATVSKMFDYSFANFENRTLVSKDNLDMSVKVAGGKDKSVAVRTNENICALVKKGNQDNYEVRYDLKDSVKAPVKQGDIVGKAYLTRNGEIVATYDVVSAGDVARANIFDIIKRITEKW